MHLCSISRDMMFMIFFMIGDPAGTRPPLSGREFQNWLPERVGRPHAKAC